MPCLDCGDREGNTCGCIPVHLRRRRRPQRSVPPSTGQVQQSTGTARISGPATSHMKRDQQTHQGEQSEQDTIRPAAAPSGQEHPLAPQRDLTGQQTVYSWPRTTGIEYNAQSCFAIQHTSLPRRKEGIQFIPRDRSLEQQTILVRPRGPQHSPKARPLAHQLAHSTVGGQISISSEKARHGSAGVDSVQLQRAGQEVAKPPIPGTASVARRSFDPFETLGRTGGRLVELSIIIVVNIAPRFESNPIPVSMESFLDQLAENYNNQTSSQRIVANSSESELNEWVVEGYVGDPPTFNSPRKLLSPQYSCTLQVN